MGDEDDRCDKCFYPIKPFDARGITRAEVKKLVAGYLASPASLKVADSLLDEMSTGRSAGWTQIGCSLGVKFGTPTEWTALRVKLLNAIRARRLVLGCCRNPTKSLQKWCDITGETKCTHIF